MIYIEDISCLVVDDDLVDRMTTLSFLQKYPNMKLLGEYESSAEALNAAQRLHPEVLFLDINMPGLTGLQIRRQLMTIPACVFITSHLEYAAEGFEVEALDFLVKPFPEARFENMMRRLTHFFEIRKKAEALSHTLDAGTIFIKEGTNQVRLQLQDILYLEALKDYTGIITANRKYMVLEPLGSLITQRTFTNFIRIHRSYAVNRELVNKFNANEVMLGDNITLPIGRSYKDSIRTMF